VPVLIDALEYKTKGKPNAIHFIATLEEVALPEDGIGHSNNQGFADSFATSSEVKIADIIRKVKDESGMMVKFLPDGMLTGDRAGLQTMEKTVKQGGEIKVPRKNA
jgi:hypothetical protein